MRKRYRPLFIFYLLVAYIFTSFIWWSYHLWDTSREAFEDKKALLHLQYEQQNRPHEDVHDSEAYKKLRNAYRNEKWMVIGEGSVFLLVLLLGVWWIHRGFKREMALANQQKNFLLSITHELKSPLASIKLALQTFLRRTLSPEKAETLLGNSLNDVARLQTLVDNILLAAKIENHTYPYTKEAIDLSALLTELIERMQLQDDGNHTFERSVASGVQLEGDRVAITSLVLNLVENAVKYSDPGTVVKVGLGQEGHKAVLEVIDQGSGIPDKDKAAVFERFYRLGNEEVRKVQGTGLGLYIVKHVVHAHGGEIKVIDNQPKGTIFRVILPLKAV